MNDFTLLQSKKIGILCQYFPPEGGAAANRMAFFSYWLQKYGAEVVILTAMPNYPQGIIHKEYKWRFWMREHGQYGTIFRSWCYASTKRSIVHRLLNYLTFMFSSLRWLVEMRRCELIIFSSGPMFAGFAAFVCNKLFGVRVVLDARDLWPDRIWESGAVRFPTWIESLLHKYEQYMYRHVVAITCATKGVCDAITGRTKSLIPIIVVRNCDQTIGFGSVPTSKTRSSQRNLHVVEAGTIGWAQDPETLCAAFGKLLERGESGIDLSFAGSGPRVSKLLIDIQSLSGKAKYVGNLSSKELEQFLESADIGVVTLAPTEHNLMTVSRRVYDYARAGLAIIYCGAGEGADIIEESGAGIVVEPGNIIALSEVLSELSGDKSKLLFWKKKSKTLLEGEFSPESVAGVLVNILRTILESETISENKIT